MSEIILPNENPERKWYYHDTCEVYGHMLIQVCWLCGDTDVEVSRPSFRNQSTALSVEELTS